MAYLAEPLNIHRRHDRSVTGSLDQKSHLGEIAMMHDLISKRLGRPLDLMRDQRSYRELLKKQFGLTTRPRKKQYPAP
ncbi:hypothetical protein [Asaia spathodeae]|uniref:hypothetical protein n=1 Tax=Asaia spathodeae TaxID=657016 RepID=UPI002FC2910E